MPTTIALRFRDLAGPTIPGHRERIKAKGSAWWAWWSKPEEWIPRDLLAELTSRLEQGEQVELFLVDSGLKQVYRARLASISVAQGNNRLPSPDAERTPVYYKDQDYLVWFEFSEIRDPDPATPEEQLTNYSYAELPEGVFADDAYREDFNGKRVFDVSELLGRHRTMYFLRPAQAEDPVHKVTLGASKRNAPFISRAIELPSDYILHLSDLHFGAHHAFPLKTHPPQRNLAIRVMDDLKSRYDDRPPGAVILSGDFTWLGTANEFEQAAALIDELQSLYKLHPCRFVICPGNHDIQWAEIGPGDEYAPKAPVTRAKAAAEVNYRGFAAAALQLGFPADSLAMGRRYLLSNFMPIDIISVNSSQLEERHFAGYGFVSREQLVDAAEAMGWTTSPEKGPKLRMLVLHHHVVPVVPQEEIFNSDERYSLTLDAAQLLYTALEYGVDLVVHGHQHQPFAASYGRVERTGAISRNRRLAIQAIGSAGVKPEHIPPNFGRNSYCVYEISETGVNVVIRSTSEDQVEVHAGTRHDQRPDAPTAVIQ
jgi:predicted phosphodiesterase